jgi:polynucleotide 5'-triphosphatase
VPNGVLEKTRVADLNIYSPNQAFDYRISVSLENPGTNFVDHEACLGSIPYANGLILASVPKGDHMYERNKDRLSYSQGNLQFDLTQVKSPVGQRHLSR